MTAIANLLVSIKADTTKLKKGLKDSTKSVKTFGNTARKNAKKASEGLDRAAKSSDKLKASFAKLITVAGGLKIVSDIFTKGRQFSASIADLSAITGATGKDLDYLREATKEFGRTTTLSASDAATAFKLVASAKPDLLKNLPALKQVTAAAITLAEASGTELPEAAATLGGALNQFGADAKEAERFMNVLAAGAQLGSAEVGDVAAALKESGVLASQSKLSFEETNAAIQALAKDSIKAEKAGTSLKNILLILRTQSDRYINPEMVGLANSLDELASRNLDAAQLVKLFGRESVAAAASLIKNRDVVKSLISQLTGTKIGYEQAATKASAFDGRVKALKSSFEALYLELFEKMKPALTDIINGLRDGINWMTKNIDTVTKFAVVIGAGGVVITALVALKLAVWAANTAFTTLFTTVKGGIALMTKFGGVFGIITAAAVGWGIGKLIRKEFVEARVGALYFVKSTVVAWEYLKYATKAAAEVISASFMVSFDYLTSKFKAFLNLIAGALEKIPGLSKDAEAVKKYADSFKTAKDRAEDLKKTLANLATERNKSIEQTKKSIADLIDFEMKAKDTVEKTKKTQTKTGTATDNAKKSFGYITDVATGKSYTLDPAGSGNIIEIKVTADKEGLINATVNNPAFNAKVTQQVTTATKDAARATRR